MYTADLDCSVTEIRAALAVLVEPGSVVELRALHTRQNTTSGYFNDLDAAAEAAARLSGSCDGVYVTLNPVRSELLARAENRVKGWARYTTADSDILSRRWLPIDFDPVRPSGISATDEEKRLAFAAAKRCREWLIGLGWPEPLCADSGNGAHLLCRIDMPADDASRSLIEGMLRGIGDRFSGEGVSVDRTTFNAARIWKLYGTASCKGDSTADRPHRMSRLLYVPEPAEATP